MTKHNLGEDLDEGPQKLLIRKRIPVTAPQVRAYRAPKAPRKLLFGTGTWARASEHIGHEHKFARGLALRRQNTHAAAGLLARVARHILATAPLYHIKSIIVRI